MLTILTPEQTASTGGIPSEAIAGVLEDSRNPDGPLSPDNVRPNPAFAPFMQQVIGEHGPGDPELKAEAQRQGSGSIGIIDLRTPDGVMGREPPEDIVGWFAVENGVLGGYHPNDKHVIFSANGLVQLPPSLRDLHIRELMRLKVEQK